MKRSKVFILSSYQNGQLYHQTKNAAIEWRKTRIVIELSVNPFEIPGVIFPGRSFLPANSIPICEMEDWQRNYMKTHLIDLIRVTVPNTRMVLNLYADGVLSKDEMEKLQTLIERDAQSEVSMQLFDILVTRENSYRALGKAASATDQSDTFYILLKGLVVLVLQQSGFHWEDLVLDRILNECKKEDVLDFFLSKLDKPNIFENDLTPSSCSVQMWNALKLLYPELAEVYFKNENMSTQELPKEIFVCDLLQTSAANKDRNKSVMFLHTTFAEFFVAELFKELFTGRYTFKEDEMLEKFIQVFFSIVADDKSPFLVYLVNSSLMKLDFVSVPSGVPKNSAMQLRKFAVSDILCDSIRTGYVYIVRLVKSILSKAFSPQNVPREILHMRHFCYSRSLTRNVHWRSFHEYLCAAADYGNFAMVRELCSLYEECFGENLDDVFGGLSSHEITPLHYAKKSQNYSLVEYFADRIPLSGRGLIYDFVTNTTWYSPDAVKGVIDICKQLLGKCDSLLNEDGLYKDHGPLYAEKVHVEIIKFLVLHGANTQSVALHGGNLLMWHFQWLEKRDFCELCKFFLSDFPASYLFQRKMGKWRDPLPTIIAILDLALLAQIHQVSAININGVDSKHNNLVLCSIHEQGDLNVVKWLVEKGVDLHRKNKYGRGALHLATECKNAEFVKYFLSQGLSVEDQDNEGNAPNVISTLNSMTIHQDVQIEDIQHLESRDAQGNTPLLVAAQQKKGEIIKFLLSKNADPLVVDDENNNFAHIFGAGFARESFFMETYSSLLQSKNSQGRTPLHQWLATGEPLDPGIIEKVMKISGEDINAADTLGQTLFLSTVAHKYKRCEMGILTCLLSLGADPQREDNNEQNVLHITAGNDDLSLYKYLESLGASPNHPDNKGNTSLHIAAKQGLLRSIKDFMTPKSDLLTRNTNGQNMAHVGKLKRLDDKHSICSLLDLPQGPQLLKMQDDKGQTPLHCWIEDLSDDWYFNAGLLDKIVTQCGIDVNKTDKKGNTMLDSAIKTQRFWIAKCLLEHGAKSNAGNKWGDNALHFAVRRACEDKHEGEAFGALEFLVSFGCDTSQSNKDGLTPFQLAVSLFPPELMNKSKAQTGHHMSRFEYLCTAVRYPNVALGLYAESSEENLHDICHLLCSAVETLQEEIDYSLVEYIARRLSLPRKGLLYHCAKRTRSHSLNELKTVIGTCDMIFRKYKALLNENLLRKCSNSLFAKDVHLGVIKYLVRHGGDTQMTNGNGQNLIEWHLLQLEGTDFSELCRFLIFDIQAFHLFKPHRQKWKDPLLSIVDGIDVTTLEHILTVPGVNLNASSEDGDNLILCSIMGGDLSVVQFLVENGVDPHHKNIYGRGSLHKAAEHGNVELVKYFLSQGLSLEDQDRYGHTPLHRAGRNLEELKYLISQNANIKAVSRDGDNIAHCASRYVDKKSEQVVEYLLSDKTATAALFDMPNGMGETPIDILCEKQYFPKVKNIHVLPEGLKVGVTKENGHILFLLAIANGQRAEVLQFFLEQGVNPLLDDRLKDKTLHLASKKGNLEAVKILVSLGLSLDCRDKDGNTPLLLSAKNLEVAKYLISNNADPFVVNNENNNVAHMLGPGFDFEVEGLTGEKYRSLLIQINKAGRTPLQEWFAVGVPLDPDTITRVINVSMENINAKDGSGGTMFLRAAAKNYDEDVMKCLCRLGADPKAVDNYGQNALHLCSAHNGGSLLNFLESVGVCPNQPDFQGQTPLFYAIEENDLELVQKLIEIGADPHHKNFNGQGALHVAAGCEDTELVAYFMSKGCLLEDKDVWGNTPWLEADTNLEVLKYLISPNANIHAVNHEGDTIAHRAAKNLGFGYEDDVVQFLLSFKTAEILFEQQNKILKTPLEYLNDDGGYFPEQKNSGSSPGVVVTTENSFILFRLAIANRQGNEVLQFLLHKCVERVLDNSLKFTALHLAAKTGNLEAVQLLVSAGVPLESRDDEGNTPLLLSAKNMEVAKYLISQGADPLVEDNKQNNIAHKFGGSYDFAAGHLTLELYRSLFKAKNMEGRTPLHQWITACVSVDPDTITEIAKNSCGDVNAVDSSGRTMFLSAVSENYEENVLRCFLRLGADPKMIDYNGQNALHLSTVKSGTSLYKFIESLGVAPDQTDNNGDNPLFVASKQGLHKVQDFMILNTDLLATNANGQNVAHVGKLPEETNNEAVIHYLLEQPQGPELFNMADYKGQTPLHCWIADPDKVWVLNEEIIDAIVQKARVDFSKTDKDGNTMFLSAVKENSPAGIWWLQTHGCNLNAVNNCGDNAIHLAVRNFCGDKVNSKAILDFIINRGCNLFHKNNEGLTPLQLAMSLKDRRLLPQERFEKIAGILLDAEEK